MSEFTTVPHKNQYHIKVYIKHTSIHSIVWREILYGEKTYHRTFQIDMKTDQSLYCLSTRGKSSWAKNPWLKSFLYDFIIPKLMSTSVTIDVFIIRGTMQKQWNLGIFYLLIDRASVVTLILISWNKVRVPRHENVVNARGRCHFHYIVINELVL